MTNFQIVIPAYNVEKFIIRCLDSAVSQDYDSDKVEFMVIDDASTDHTRQYIDDFFTRWPFAHVNLVHNVANMKMPYNLRRARQGNPDDVVIILDADDYLPHAQVLSTLAEHYLDHNLWLTYGSYSKYPEQPIANPALPYSQEVIWNRGFRAHTDYSCYNHPITFRRKVWQHVEDWELQDDDGNWFGRSYDHVIMMPMLEMTVGHFEWLPDTLYVYNEENPLSEAKLDNPGLDPFPIVNAREPRLPMCKYYPYKAPA